MKIIDSKGIVLNRFKYSETSVIINILTEHNGKMSFIANGVRKKKAKIQYGYFQPLNIITFEFYESTKTDLHRIKEVSPNPTLQNIFFEVQRSAVCMFLAELINQLHPYFDQNKLFFNFLENLVLYIDSTDLKSLKNINLWTIIKLLYFIGIQPDNNYGPKEKYFNPIEGLFTNNKYANSHIFSEENSKLVSLFLSSNIGNNHEIEIGRVQKQDFLKLLLEYIQIHFDGFKTGKSLDILMEIFD